MKLPSATGSPGVEDPAAMEGTSANGPTTGLEGIDVEMGVGDPSSRVGEETGSALKDIPGTGGEETTAETTGVDSTPRTSQNVLGDLAEDWLETGQR